jgi:uncharacterized Zn finger protein (UPF0148 family)
MHCGDCGYIGFEYDTNEFGEECCPQCYSVDGFVTALDDPDFDEDTLRDVIDETEDFEEEFEPIEEADEDEEIEEDD